MLVLNRKAVERSLKHSDCIDIVRSTMRSVSAGDIVMPLRYWMPVPDSGGGKMAVMPGYLGDPRCFGIKLVNKFPRPAESELGTHVGAVIVFDAEEGTPVAMLDAGAVTAVRTSAASALASQTLARKDARTLTILGAGEQAYHHIRAHESIPSIREVLVWARKPDRAQAMIDSLDLRHGVQASVATDIEPAVTKADILCAVTSANEPVFHGAWLSPGAHVNLVGAAVRDAKETDSDTVLRSRFFVDYRASAFDQAGELLDAAVDGDPESLVAGEIGEVIAGKIEGRQSDEQITVYKSLGVAAQDLAAGLHALAAARQLNVGVEVDW